MDALKDFGVLIGVLAGLFGLYKGVIEFHLQGKQKRAEIFLKKQAEYFGNKSFNELRSMIETNEPALATHSFEEKRAYLTFFEEIAVLKNSGLLNATLTYYMFGYYATKCLESDNFWSNVNRNDVFWNVFSQFAKEMQTRLRENNEIVSHLVEV